MAGDFEHGNLIKFTFLWKVQRITKDVRSNVKEERVFLQRRNTNTVIHKRVTHHLDNFKYQSTTISVSNIDQLRGNEALNQATVSKLRSFGRSI
jgi:hypothetical protein